MIIKKYIDLDKRYWISTEGIKTWQIIRLMTLLLSLSFFSYIYVWFNIDIKVIEYFNISKAEKCIKKRRKGDPFRQFYLFLSYMSPSYKTWYKLSVVFSVGIKTVWCCNYFKCWRCFKGFIPNSWINYFAVIYSLT